MTKTKMLTKKEVLVLSAYFCFGAIIGWCLTNTIFIIAGG